jgi:hypothetical protein
MKGFSWNIGFLLLGIYLLLVGLASIASLAIPPLLIGVLAIISGIFILIGR